jgi:superfamily II DNA or RNA helicase/HKD family nuclease
MSLPPGLYETLLTQGHATALEGQAHVLANAPGLVPDLLLELLTRHLATLFESMASEPGDGGDSQLALALGVLARARELLAVERPSTPLPDLDDLPRRPPTLLRQVGLPGRTLQAPETGLLQPWLFTAGRGSPSLLHEIRREVSACDRVDLLISFITLSGVRKVLDLLQQLARSSEGDPAVPLIRVLTTTYTGATELEALDQLAALPGCEVRVSLDGRRSRLHAKAWIFRRASGFGSAYIGSANLSGAAMTGGLEWTVKLTQRGQAPMYDMACAHFEALWADAEFERYDPTVDASREALRAALKQERGTGAGQPIALFDIQPKPFQQELLDQLEAERALSRHRLLLVAATGTGKTVIAALDYRQRVRRQEGRYPRLLFVAHRGEILQQALATYRTVLRDPGFGDVLAGGREPGNWDHLFTTIDSLDSRDLLSRFGEDHWHNVVIDECHHMAASRFERFCRRVQPEELLGLTATPERADGKPITGFFDPRPDGRAAAELRLWHALDLQLLVPFEYFGCDDSTDLGAVPWGKAGELAALRQALEANTARAQLVMREWERLAGRSRMRRALAFCVSIEHAEFMARAFNEAGLKAACITSNTPPEERERAPHRLRDGGDLQVLVTVDLFNEGIDLPFVDTLLLLRPTQSPVVFQQQLGRGLRLNPPHKDSCLVLDFVGRHNESFRFDRLLGAITGQSRRELLNSVERGFATLPAGCHIQLQPRAREQVLARLRQLTDGQWSHLRHELRAWSSAKGQADPPLAAFLSDQALELGDIFRPQGHSGWLTLRHQAGLVVAEPTPESLYFSGRMHSLLHIDDVDRLQALRSMAEGAMPDEGMAQCLAYQVDAERTRVGPAAGFLARLRQEPAACDELRQLAALLEAQARALPPLPGLEETPLRLHARYALREILTAVGWLTAEKRTPATSGVLPLAGRRTELFFVTLDKSQGFHDRTAYRDHAIDPTHFHWQSQNSARRDRGAGQRYLGAPDNGWQFQLFVRERPGDAYAACGPVQLVSAEGDKPISIIWRLAAPLPARLFSTFSVLRGS